MAQFYRESYYSEPHPVLLATDQFDYGQHEDLRSKTPTSLINHPGHSPVPLSTPPMSRNPSHLPNQAPEFMMYDDSADSPSDSPTSITTPDNELFEVEMLDSDPVHNHYTHQSLNPLVTNQLSDGAILAPQATEVFSDQAIQQALREELALQQFQDTQTSSHAQPSQSTNPYQMYDHNYVHNYTSQSYHDAPWNSQRVPFGNIPPSSITLFDPASDFDFLSNLAINQNVNSWTWNHTNPDNLISPNEPAPQPRDRLLSVSRQDAFQPQPAQEYQSQHQLQHRGLHYYDYSPVGLTMNIPSPNPDAQNFVNYDQSSAMFTENYVTRPQFPPSTTEVPMIVPVSYSSSVGNISRSSSTMGQPANSPYNPAAHSPNGSEGMFALYQSSESMNVESFVHEQSDHKSVPPPSPGTDSRASDTSPDAEPESARPARLSATNKGGTGRPGGRALGTHLEPTVAKAAHDMRKIVACWHCVLQRDKCGPGDTCERCLKRSQRPNADCGLGCVRVKLADLTEYFLPSLVTQMHEDAQLTHFVSQHIHQWGNREITIPMTCGQKSMPRIPVKVYEFLPIGDELLVQIQYKTDPKTHKRVAMKKKSPALGMVQINHNEEKRYDRYISEIVDNHINAFGNLCWMEGDNDFQKKLFRLISRVQTKNEEEAKLLREVLRLIVCTFIMSHTLTIAEEDKHAVLSKMHSYGGRHDYVENFTSPRMTNRQLKYFFCRIHRTIMSNVLNKLQQIFKSSRGCDRWIVAFVVVVGMCMAHEEQQVTIHLIMETKARTEGLDHRELQARADIACRDIDTRMGLITNIFRWKYNRKCNPLRDADHDWDREIGFGDASSVGFVRNVAQLVKENIDFLRERQNVSIASTNQEKYTSRLVARFVLSFWLPQI